MLLIGNPDCRFPFYVGLRSTGGQTSPWPEPWTPDPDAVVNILDDCQTDTDCRKNQICVGGKCRSLHPPGGE